MAPALHCEQEISIGNVIGDNIITITLVFGLVALIRSFQVSLSEILSTVRASHRKNTRSATHILATYSLFFSAGTSWLECLRFFVAQKFLDAEDVTGLMIKHGCLPMPQRIEVYLENPHVLCLYYSGDFCRLFSDAKMLDGAELTFSLTYKGAEACLTVSIL